MEWEESTETGEQEGKGVALKSCTQFFQVGDVTGHNYTGKHNTGHNYTGTHDTGHNYTGEHDTGEHDTGVHDTGVHDTGKMLATSAPLLTSELAVAENCRA